MRRPASRKVLHLVRIRLARRTPTQTEPSVPAKAPSHIITPQTRSSVQSASAMTLRTVARFPTSQTAQPPTMWQPWSNSRRPSAASRQERHPFITSPPLWPTPARPPEPTPWPSAHNRPAMASAPSPKATLRRQKPHKPSQSVTVHRQRASIPSHLAQDRAMVAWQMSFQLAQPLRRAPSPMSRPA